MISSAVAFHTNGFGSVFQCCAQVVMACLRSSTLVNTPRRSRLSVSSLNQRSTTFSQELEVGVKCRCQRRRSLWASHFVTSGAVWAERWDGLVDLFEEPQHVRAGMAFAQVGEDFTGADVHRREQIDRAVPLVVMDHRLRATALHPATTAASDPVPGIAFSHRS